MSTTISVKEVIKEPAAAAKRFSTGDPLVIDEEGGTWLLAHVRGIDLSKGAFGTLVGTGNAVAAGKSTVIPNELLLQLANSLETDDDVQTQALPAVVAGGTAIGIVVGALVVGAIAGSAVAWYSNSGGGKKGSKTTVKVTTESGTVNVGPSGQPGEEPRGK